MKWKRWFSHCWKKLLIPHLSLMSPSRYDWKTVDWDVKPQHNQPTLMSNTHYLESHSCFHRKSDLSQKGVFNCKMSQSMTEPTKWPVCPAKTWIRLSICPVWSVFAVHLKVPCTQKAHNEDSERLVNAQADLSTRDFVCFCLFCRALAQI